MNERFKSAQREEYSVFLSHSSRDRAAVDTVFEALQKAEKINDGLARCELGILFLSTSFLDPKAGWTKAEMNYFFHRRMSDKKRFLCINVDLTHEAIPPLLQDYRYVSLSDRDAMKQIVDAVRKRSASVVRRKYCYTKEYVKPRNLAAFTRLPRRVSRPAVLRLGSSGVATSARFNGLKSPALAMLKPRREGRSSALLDFPPALPSRKTAGLVTCGKAA